MILTIIVFILILGVLIFVHEMGHFITAKRAGVRVDEFGFGFPPRIWGKKIGETIYSINLFPIGGFVKIYGEEGQGKKNPRSFASKSVGRRAWIIVAGVLMNFALAAVLLSVGFLIGLPDAIDDSQQNVVHPRVLINEVTLDSPAEQIGIKPGDIIISLRSEKEQLVSTKAGQIQDFINRHKGQEITLTIQRQKEILEKNVVPRENYAVNDGPVGIGLVRIDTVPWYKALYKGFTKTIEVTIFIVIVFAELIWNLMTAGRLAYEIGGPVKIFNVTGQAVEMGLIYVLQFAALININIAIINILPIPALDGGRLLFLAIEKIKGSPINQKVENYAHTVGFVLLILLIIAITWRDIFG